MRKMLKSNFLKMYENRRENNDQESIQLPSGDEEGWGGGGLNRFYVATKTNG